MIAGAKGWISAVQHRINSMALDPDARAMIMRLLRKIPNQRRTTRDVISHNWVQQAVKSGESKNYLQTAFY